MSRTLKQTSRSASDALGSGVGRAAAIVIVSVLVSRILGFVRQAAINAEFGVGPEADAWFAAFRVPDTIFMLFAGGALLSAVIPVYAEVRARGDRGALGLFVARVATLVALATGILSGAGALLAEPLMHAVAPGFPDATLVLATEAARWLMVSPLVLAVSAVAKAALQAERSFKLSAISPVVYNLGIIAGALGLAQIFGLPGLVWGTLIGTGLHLFVQLPGLWRIVRTYKESTESVRSSAWDPGAALRDSDVRKVIRLMMPRMLGVAVLQASLIYVNILASLQGPSAVAALNNAFLLMLLPLGVFAMALGEAVLPDLAHRWISGERKLFAQQVRGVTRHVLFLNAPAALVLFVLAEPIVTVLFERGAFDPRATELTANVLRFYAVGLLGHAAVEVLVRGFFAMHDTRTPVAVGVASLILHVLLSWVFSLTMGYIGIALGLSISVLAEAVVLAMLLRRRGGLAMQSSDPRWILRVAVAAGVMTAVIQVLMLITWEPGGSLRAVGLLASYLIAALGTYLAAGRLLGILELDQFRQWVARRLWRAEENHV